MHSVFIYILTFPPQCVGVVFFPLLTSGNMLYLLFVDQIYCVCFSFPVLFLLPLNY